MSEKNRKKKKKKPFLLKCKYYGNYATDIEEREKNYI